MTLIELDETQRKGLAGALYNAANIVLASVVIGQTVSAAPFRSGTFIGGVVMLVVLYGIATRLNKERKEEKG